MKIKIDLIFSLRPGLVREGSVYNICIKKISVEVFITFLKPSLQSSLEIFWCIIFFGFIRVVDEGFKRSLPILV